jgi:Uma2 family endonuclease
MSTQPKHHYTLGEYFSVEQESDIRHEYYSGEIYAMVGGSLNHNRIKENVSRRLGNQLEGRGCQVLSSDMRVKTPSGLYTYPDVLVLCGEPEIEVEQGKETLLNPLLIVEVLSKSTRAFDKEGKFDHYKTISSFSEYVLIDQYQPHVMVYVKQKDGNWLMSENKDINGAISLPIVNCNLIMGEVYELVKFHKENTPRSEF